MKSEDRFKELRQKAEHILLNMPKNRKPTQSNDLKILITELQTHHIELELQNEELKHAHQELETARNQYFDLFDLAPVGYITIDKTGAIRQANLTAAALLGTEKQLLIKTRLSQYIPDQDLNVFRHSLNETIHKKTHQICQLELKQKDGKVVHSQMAWNAVPEGGNDIKEIRIVMTDITPLKDVEQQLRMSKDEWQKTFDAIDDVITIQDCQMRVTQLNLTALKISGKPENEVIGSFCYQLFENRTSPCDGCPVETVFQKGIPGFNVIKSGKLNKTFRVAAYPIFDDNRALKKIVHIAQDITEQEIMESRLRHVQKMESMGTLTGGIAHQFNNILSIILGNNELAMDEIKPWNPAMEYMKEIHQAGLRAKNITLQLLNFCRKPDNVAKPMNLSPVITEALKSIGSSIPDNIDIRQDIPGNLDTVLADAAQIHQVIINLYSNAARAMKKTGGIFSVGMANEIINGKNARRYHPLAPGRYLKLVISDTGKGIDKKNIPRIFEPFFTTNEQGAGSGLGLAVVHGIVEKHNGAVFVESEPEKGTVFTILFPVFEGIVNNQDEQKPDNATGGGSEKILYVDDEPSIVNYSKIMLKNMGYQVQSTTSPMEALKKFKESPDDFDLVITDMAMPKITGEQLAQKILEIRPGMPIILCTGFSENMSKGKARKIGISAFASKPLTRNELAMTVRQVIDNARKKT